MKESAYRKALLKHGADILFSPSMQSEKHFLQHGRVSVFTHSIAAACTCICIARILRARLGIRLNERALIRGALLHDYFLYDWRTPDRTLRLHGVFHARRAFENASRDFALGEIERDMILRHMFPLNLTPPACPESILLCIADKLCAADETLTRTSRYRKISRFF